MIVRPRPGWLGMLFVWRGSVLRDILPQMVAFTGFAILVTVFHGQVYTWKVPLNFVPFSLIGLSLAVFLGFRNSTSYARYWEARTLWGSVLNASRTLLRQALTLDDEPLHAGLLLHRLIAFVQTLRHQVRRSDAAMDLRRLLTPEDCARAMASRYKPAVLLLMIGEWIRERRMAGGIVPTLVLAMEGPLGHLDDALGGCERLASTPIPFSYSVIIHRTIYSYCLMLPFGLVDSIGPMTPLVVGFIAYTFFALEAISAEIEEPFGTSPNDLALDAMCRMIERTLRELAGEGPGEEDPPALGFQQT